MVQTTRNLPKSVYVYGPKSFTTLTLVGFSFVALPIIFALIYSAYHVDLLADRSQSTVYKAVKATRNTRILLEQLTEMERTVRQYHVLNDRTLLQSYADRHQTFQRTLEILSTSLKVPSIISQLKALSVGENKQFNIINLEQTNSSKMDQAIAEFAPLAKLALKISVDSSEIIDLEVDEMRQTSEQTLKTIIWLSFAMIPATIIFSGVFTVLLNRPIKQIDHAIRLLGDGEFSLPVTVTGPHNLEYLGQRLNWLRRKLQDAENQKTKFIRHVSHELKTPLTALREGTELLADEIVGTLKDDQREVVQILRQNSIRLQRLIEDLLNFNMATSQSTLNMVNPVHLDDVICRVAADHKLPLVAKNIKLDTDLMPCVVEGDDEKLRVIVDNLLSNAIKYSPTGGKITISLREDNSLAVLDVYDTGPGIPREESKKIFDTFFQGNPPHDGHIKGSGLGLSIAREHVHAHHGIIMPLFDSLGAHLQVVLPQKQIPYVKTA